MISRPDVLVLGGGGVLGEAWMMGVLAGVEDATGVDMRACEHFVGTSAGSIVAAHLAAGRTPRRPSSLEPATEAPEDLEPVTGSASATAARRAAERAGRWAFAASAPLVPVALSAAGPGGAVVRAALLSRIPHQNRSLGSLRQSVERSDARFDGRLRVTAVERRSGRRCVFGSPGAPSATVGEAVQASCTVPWLFAPVKISGRDYVDGGMWSPTNLDVAPAGRDTCVLCLNPTAGIGGTHTLVTMMRNYARSSASVETVVLRRRGALVQTFGPDAACAGEMGWNFMDPAPRARVLASGYRQGLAMGTSNPWPSWPNPRPS